jgi:hypothetical protein
MVRRFSFVIAFVLCASRAVADEAAAEKHFLNGRQHARDGDWSGAVAAFDASVREQPSIGAYLNLGDALERVGRFAAADAAFTRAEELAGTTDETRAREAIQRRARLRPRIPTVTVVAAPERARILFDSNVPLERGLRVPIDAGRHTVVAVVDGAPVQTVTVDAREGTSHDIVLVPHAAPSPPSSVPWLPIWLGAGALSGAAVGSVFGILAMDDKSDLERLCPAYPRCTGATYADAERIDDRFGDRAAVATTAFVVAGVFAIASIYALVSRTTPPRTVGAF